MAPDRPGPRTPLLGDVRSVAWPIVAAAGRVRYSARLAGEEGSRNEPREGENTAEQDHLCGPSDGPVRFPFFPRPAGLRGIGGKPKRLGDCGGILRGRNVAARTDLVALAEPIRATTGAPSTARTKGHTTATAEFRARPAPPATTQASSAGGTTSSECLGVDDHPAAGCLDERHGRPPSAVRRASRRLTPSSADRPAVTDRDVTRKRPPRPPVGGKIGGHPTDPRPPTDRGSARGSGGSRAGRSSRLSRFSVFRRKLRPAGCHRVIR
jgi:hypothetical protein